MQPTPPTPAPYTPPIPDDQSQKAALALRLAKAWKDNPQLVFIWTTQAAFETTAAAYSQAVQTKAAAAALRPAISADLERADTQIQAGLPYLKAALLLQFKAGFDKAMYPQFGIETRHKGYDLPRGQAERAKALGTLLKGLATHGLEAGEYGQAYWAPIAQAYQTAADAAVASATVVGGLVGTKHTLEEQVDLVLSHMLVLLEAQYLNPAELEAKRRELGYLKEYN